MGAPTVARRSPQREEHISADNAECGEQRRSADGQALSLKQI
jgi:hypothetical protein